MHRNRIVTSALLIVIGLASVARGDNDGSAWRPLFNGEDLSGWERVNCAPGTFSVRDRMIVSTGVPTGVLRSDRHYENFELELEWRHMKPKGNAGLFVWSGPLPVTGQPFTKSIEVQILDGRNTPNYTSHGDVFSIQGATMKPDRPHPGGWATRCLPSERRCKPSPEWNHYRVVCKDGAVKLAVNGKVVSGGSDCNPRRGYICLESEGSECHFRNIRIRELPSSKTPAALTAPLAQGFQSLYSGIDLSGWKLGKDNQAHWTPKDWTLGCNGKGDAKDERNLWTRKAYGNFVLIADWRLTRKPVKRKLPVIRRDGDIATSADGSVEQKEMLDAGGSGIRLRGSSRSQVDIWCSPAGSGGVPGYRNDGSQPPGVRAAATPRKRADRPAGQWNRFVITLRGERLTVELNGQTVVEDARLPGVPASGPIGLVHGGAPIQFANLFLRELD